MLVGWITERVSFLGTVLVYPGEDEMRTLAAETLAVLQNASTPTRLLSEHYDHIL